MENGGALSSLGAALALLGTAFILTLSRRWAMLPIFASVCLLPIGQALQVAGLNFFLFRLVLLAALVRALIRGEVRAVAWTRLDTLVSWWAVAYLVFGTLSHGANALVGLMGMLYNGLGSYIVARCLLRDRRDYLLHIRFLAVILIPLVAAMAYEKATARNVFAVLGGVNEITFLREGKLRAQGAFAHPIIAGAFGATTLPLMVGLMRMRDRGLRRAGTLGALGSAFVAWAAASSGAVLAAGASVVALILWRRRHSLNAVFLALAMLAVVLQLGMSRPLWWIFDSIGDLTGGTGWHRSYIIDAGIRHFGEWALAGTPVTAHWGGYPPPPNDPNNIDLTNQFLVEAVGGGVVRLGLFIAIIWTCFRQLGRAFRTKRGSIRPDTEWLAWTTGVALLSHCVCFFSVAYFDQMIFYFFWLISAICAGTLERGWLLRDRAARAAPVVRPELIPQPSGSH